MDDGQELTTRDVLQQIDRRLTALEEGLRAQGAELRAGIGGQGVALRTEIAQQGKALYAEIAQQGKALHAEIAEQGKALRAEIAALRSEMVSGLRWLVGLILVSWLSMMGMMLPLLLRP